jgi:hypothetical protein
VGRTAGTSGSADAVPVVVAEGVVSSGVVPVGVVTADTVPADIGPVDVPPPDVSVSVAVLSGVVGDTAGAA